MTLSSEVEDGRWALLQQQSLHNVAVADIAVDKGVALVAAHALKVRGISGVGEFIEIDDPTRPS